ncbi:hypothetical protein MC885_008492 [Smutsia gigantea]|nr:hypothetical protein MC885_008492 [Smutsia gigantea]
MGVEKGVGKKGLEPDVEDSEQFAVRRRREECSAHWVVGAETQADKPVWRWNGGSFWAAEWRDLCVRLLNGQCLEVKCDIASTVGAIFHAAVAFINFRELAYFGLAYMKGTARQDISFTCSFGKKSRRGSCIAMMRSCFSCESSPCRPSLAVSLRSAPRDHSSGASVSLSLPQTLSGSPASGSERG